MLPSAVLATPCRWLSNTAAAEPPWPPQWRGMCWSRSNGGIRAVSRCWVNSPSIRIPRAISDMTVQSPNSLSETRLTFIQRIWQLNWGLMLLILVTAFVGLATLYSISGGSTETWVSRQLVRFGVGFFVMLVVALVDIRFWLRSAFLIYGRRAGAAGRRGGGGCRGHGGPALGRSRPLPVAAFRSHEDRAGARARALFSRHRARRSRANALACRADIDGRCSRGVWCCVNRISARPYC